MTRYQCYNFVQFGRIAHYGEYCVILGFRKRPQDIGWWKGGRSVLTKIVCRSMAWHKRNPERFEALCKAGETNVLGSHGTWGQQHPPTIRHFFWTILSTWSRLPALAGKLIRKMRLLYNASCDLIQAYSFLCPTTLFILSQTGIGGSDAVANRNREILFSSTRFNSISYDVFESFLRYQMTCFTWSSGTSNSADYSPIPQ